MRVLVAGGAGLIGAALCRHLLARGDDVVCVDSFVTGTRANLSGLSDAGGFQLVEADVREPLDPAGPLDAVVNLACPASPADFGPLALDILTTGSAGVLHLLELARARRCRYLQASTSEVYGDPLVHPQPERYWGNVNPVGPRAVYDEAKRFGEAATAAYRRGYGVDTTIARIFNTYGPGMRPDDGRVVSNLVTQALSGAALSVHGDGRQTRSFCYVDDLVDGLVALLESGHPGPVNLGNDDERTIVDVAHLVLALTAAPGPIRHVGLPVDDPPRRRPDLALAREVLGWTAPTSLEAGLAATIEWFAGRLGVPRAPGGGMPSR